MTTPRFFVSLTTADNDYQIEQAQSAEQAARKLNVEVEIVYAGNDAISQSTQVLKAIQSPENSRPNAIIFEPVGGTALPQVAQAAVANGIGWAVLNRDASYISDLRTKAAVPVFGLTSNHIEIGRIQGRQIAALLPHGGSILYIQGPSENSAAKERTLGMRETKPANVQITVLKAQWTEESSARSVRSWLKLGTSQRAPIDLIAAQDDSMAMGARKAFEELKSEVEKERWLNLPYIGCDGLPKTGQAWVRSGLLAATVFVPPNAGQALDLLFHGLKSKNAIPERVLTVPVSIPALTELKPATQR
jgi:ribose transport system substrate-binding protein